MSVLVEFSEGLSERVGARCAYVSVEDGETLAEVVESLSAEFGPEQLPADAEAVRESAVGSEPLAPRERVGPGDRIRLEASG